MSPGPDSSHPVYDHAQILRVISGIMLCMLLAALDQTVVIPAVPAIAHGLRSYEHLSWIVTAYLLTSTVATPIFGKLSDIYGRRALMTPAIALFILASVLCAVSQSLWQLIICRGLQGIGGAGLFAMTQAAIADVVSPRERGRYQGYLAGTWAVACIIGPVLGGYVTEGLSWRWIFWINVPLGLLAILLCDRALRLLIVVPRRNRIDVTGALLLTGSVTALLLMLTWVGTTFALLSAPVILAALLGFALLAALALQELRATDPILPPRLFRNDIFLRGVAVAFFASAGLFVATFLLPISFQLVHGYGAEASGLLVMPFLVASTAGAYLAGQMARRMGKSKMILLTGLGSAMLGFLLLSLNTADTGVVLIMIESALLGTGIGMCMPTSIVVVQNAVAHHDMGAATGTLLLLRSIGGAFGSTVAGSLLTLHLRQSEHLAHLRHSIGFGALSQGASSLGRLSQREHEIIRHGLASGFALAYLVTAVLLISAILIVIRLRDIALRSSEGPDASAIGH